MSQQEAIVRYDGPALRDHTMDVEDIAPAMLALSELCRQLNKSANGDRSNVRLLISVDIEQHCFEFRLQIVQTFFAFAKNLVDDDNVATAKNILEWLGIISSPALGLFGLLRVLRGRPPEAMTLTVQNGRDVMQVNTGGGAFYYVHPQAAALLESTEALKRAKEVLRPLTREGYESVEFQDDLKVVENISKEEAALASSLPNLATLKTTTVIPESNIRARVRIRRAGYEGKGKWTIFYDKSREVSVEDEEWLAGFQSTKIAAPPGSLLDVNIRVSEIQLDSSGVPIEEPVYTITKVFGVELPPEQRTLFQK